MQAVIMAGGFGTRLRPLTCNIPKPMVPLLNRPLLGHIVQHLKKHDIADIIVMLFHQPEIITDYLRDGSKFGVNIMYLQPEDDLGTAGSVKFAERYIKDTFLVISGDLCTDMNLTSFYKFHKRTKSEASILLTDVPNPTSFGIVITDEKHRITRFLEKPSSAEVFSNQINTGMYMLEPSVLEKIPEGKSYDFGNDLFPALQKDDTNLMGYLAKGYWKDIGNLDEYLAVHQDCLSGKVKLNLDINPRSKKHIAKSAKVSKKAVIKSGVVIGDNALIEESAYVENSVIGKRAKIRKGARIINTILWNEVKIGENTQLKNSVVASKTRIGSSSTVMDKGFIGEEVSIGDRSLIKPQVKIWPKKLVASDTVLSTSFIWGDRWLKELITDSRISGIANIEMTPEFAARVGTALGAFWGAGETLYASRDNDRSSNMITDAVHSGLNSMGVNLASMQATPIPVNRHILYKVSTAGGIHIRKSPYDEQKTDIILLDSNGMDLHPNKCKKVERLFFGEDYIRANPNQIGKREFTSKPIDVYKSNMKSALNREAIKRRKLKIVIDFSFSSAGSIFPVIFENLDIDIITLNANLNPSYLTITDEQHKEQVSQLSAIVKSLGADAGFIINSTCERLYLLDDLGRYFAGNKLLALVTKLYLQHYNPEIIASPVSAPLLIRKMAEADGAEYISCKSTHNSMIETAMLDGVGFVGGTKGGFIFTNFNIASDAMYATCKILELIANIDEPISNIIDSIKFPNMVSADISCAWDEKGKVMTGLMKKTEGIERELIHGIKIYEDKSSWVLFLPAKEEPLFTVTAESKTVKRAKELLEKWSKVLRKVRDS
ncbi:MAG: NTP transferase domain-containing protein [bacterium]|nr:NTP transferase domain-containing protein [bacterium]